MRQPVGPSSIGNALYFGTTDGRVVSLDIAKAQGPQWYLFATTTNASNQTVPDLTQPRIHVTVPFLSQTGTPFLSANQPIYNAPIGAANILAVATPQGLAGLQNQVTVVADSNRIFEVDTAGSAVVEINSTQTSWRSGRAALPLYGQRQSRQQRE